MEELLAKNVLRKVKEVLDAHEIEYWLNFGALLGVVREGKFISYDDDIELNAWAHKITEQQMKDISKELCQRGFNAYYSTLTDYISMWKDGISISLSMYTLEGNKAVRPHEYIYGPGINTLIAKCFYYLSELFARKRVGKINVETILGLKRITIFFMVILTGLLPRNLRRKLAILFRVIAIKIKGEYGKTRIPAKFYLELRDLTFCGETFKAPNNTEEYLEFIYGPDWRIPLKDWKFYHSDKKLITGIEFIDEVWDYK